MARTRTLTLLLGDIRYQADIEGATLRHTDAALTRLLNQACQRYRLKVSESGLPWYLTSTTGSLAAGVVSTTQPWTHIDLSALNPQPVWIHGVDVLYNNRLHSLESVPFEARTHFGSETGVPCRWTSAEPGKLMLMPASDGAYSYRVHYLPAMTDLSAGSDTFDPAVPGGEEWVVFDVCSKAILRDDFPDIVQLFEGKRNEIWGDIKSAGSKRRRSGPLKRVDQRGENAFARIRQLWWGR